ncbi:ASCH domain-containing protein [Streptomyces sp. NEAU-S7GS2]|uniref:ASCH domain-containing protein n=1 Tax=Streptomyces sp. NEAU-S7GS2 TaxID=2202000 RepID=UPI000D6F35D1|nr:ASCH domain-containing protein [Streptomyces sp. NEAU-S7GS2]AWN32609.1 hypothetical protein DKG71_42270 [Streptomyces sp. NEAU-S7GS2]
MTSYSPADLSIALAASPLHLRTRPGPAQLRAAITDQLVRHGGMAGALATYGYDHGRHPQESHRRLVTARRLVDLTGAAHLQPEDRAETVESTRGLTIWQPWADLITHNRKRTECRSRRTNWRGRVLIHAGKQLDESATAQVLSAGAELPDVRGAVIATARIMGCHRAQQLDGSRTCCAPWGFTQCWHWELADVQPLPHPVPATGARILWKPTPDLLAAVHAAQATPAGA